MTHTEVLAFIGKCGESLFVCGGVGFILGLVVFIVDMAGRAIIAAADRDTLGDAIARSEKRHNRWQ